MVEGHRARHRLTRIVVGLAAAGAGPRSDPDEATGWRPGRGRPIVQFVQRDPIRSRILGLRRLRRFIDAFVDGSLIHLRPPDADQPAGRHEIRIELRWGAGRVYHRRYDSDGA